MRRTRWPRTRGTEGAGWEDTCQTVHGNSGRGCPKSRTWWRSAAIAEKQSRDNTDSIVSDEMNVWIVGGISPWEINRFASELDRQIDHVLGSLMV